MADGLYLVQGRSLGLVLSVHDSWRLFTLYFGLAAMHRHVHRTGIRDPMVLHRPRLLSDNGACYVSQALKVLPIPVAGRITR